MATIEKRQGKNNTSYLITVCLGRDAQGKQVRHRKTYTPPVGWSEARAHKEAQRQAVLFEEEIEKGYQLDNRQSFQEYAAYVLETKRRQNVRERTLERYEEMLLRVNAEIGFLKLVDIRPAHLNNFYSKLQKEGSRRTEGKATTKIDLKTYLRERGLTLARVAELSGLGVNTVSLACKQAVSESSAKKIAEALGEKPEKLFTIYRDMTPLSDKTVLEHHRLISTILAQAEKEMLVPYNAAAKASPPRPVRHEPNYFQPEEVHELLDASWDAPLKYRVFLHLLVVTGARRGEIAGLKWEKLDLKTGKMHISSGLYYSGKRGIYEGDTKTGEQRWLKIPEETIELLKQLKQAQEELKEKNGVCWQETGYVFVRDDGRPMSPQTFSQWLSKFTKRHNLPHANPHAFRHTAASILIAFGTDIVTVSKLLGHASVTTTESFYAHLIEEAKSAASGTLTDVLLKKK